MHSKKQNSLKSKSRKNSSTSSHSSSSVTATTPQNQQNAIIINSPGNSTMLINNSDNNSLLIPSSSSSNIFYTNSTTQDHYNQQQQHQQQQQLAVSNGGLTNNVTKEKDKTHYKSYAGIHAKSLKIMWEQHDKSDTEVHPEVLTRLAEDTTYKLWELANNLKTSCRHSGGKLTVDIVNETLKDCNVPPVIGIGTSNWEKFDYDGTFFFPNDEILDLRDEYLKDITFIQNMSTSITGHWLMAKKCPPNNIKHFLRAICIAVFTSEESTFNEAIEEILWNPYIGCIVRQLLKKCLEEIVFEYTNDTLDRWIKFVDAICFNYHTGDVNTTDQLLHLAQLMTCMVLGPLDLNIGMAQFKKEEEEHKQMEDEINSIAQELQQSIKEEPVLSGATTSVYTTMDVDEIQNECEALLQMMASEGFEPSPSVLDPIVKQELKSDIKIFDEFHDQQSGLGNNKDDGGDYLESIGPDVKNIKLEPSCYNVNNSINFPLTNDIDMENQHQFDGSNIDTQSSESDKFSPLTTLQCSDIYAESMFKLIGNLATKWEYFEQEIIYIITKRLEIFFRNIIDWTTADYEWLVRAVQVLWTLGDYAFRELTVYFEKIDSLQVPEWVECYFSCSAIYLHGRKDIFFYEYLYDLCGDRLMPFMTYYSKLAMISNKKNPSSQIQCTMTPELKLSFLITNKNKYFIAQKLIIHTIPKLDTKYTSFDDLFPEKSQMKSREIGFKFAGCCPIKPKLKRATTAELAVERLEKQQKAIQLSKFNSKAVICKRKHIESIGCVGGGAVNGVVGGTKKNKHLYDFKYLQIN